ncbi:hypothetical protein GGF43_002828 [Coemansia sp. RSA 2618]|nr:hypothetical protein GGF43_002828 [Coemansia sp. RSA 2618]
MGSVIGSVAVFALNFRQDVDVIAVPLHNSSYIVLASLEATGAACALLLVPLDEVTRDGVMYVCILEETDTHTEAVEMFMLFRDKWILLLVPMFVVSNFFYTCEWAQINGAIFNQRTRAFNSIVYWISQIIAVFAFSFVYDCEPLSRRKRGLVLVAIVAVLANVMWGCALAFQVIYLDRSVSSGLFGFNGVLIDFTQAERAAAPTLLFCFMGIVGALWQSLAYWLIGAITNDVQSLTRYAGFYKCIQSLGAMVAWQLEAQAVSHLAQIIVNWSILVAALPFMLYFIHSINDEYDVEAERSKFKIHPANFIDIA